PGTAPLVLTGKPIVQVTGAQAGDFQVTPPAVTTVPAGGSTTFSVRFSPKAAGARTATITINSNALGTPSDVFTLTGTGLAAAITVSGNTQFAQTMLSQNAAQTFTISNPGTAPLVLTGSAPVKITGPQAGDFAVTQPSVTTIQPGGSATFSINFCPQGVGSRTATVTVTSNALGMASDALAIAGTGLDIPPVVNAAPAAGLRVKITPPEYAGTNVYYTLYLPTDWVPGKLYPVIVEYAPNDYAPAGVNGTVDDTELGYYASGGKGFIWVTMPFINYTTTPASNATMWWGNGNVTDPEGIQLTAQFCETNLIRILQNYGGNPAEVFLTGFSRGGMATGVIGLLNSQMADIWAGFIPDSGADWSTTDLALTDGRPTFFVCCQNDPNAQESYSAYQYLTSLDDPCTWNVVPNATHTATWIEDDAPAADLAIRQLLQEWLANVIATHPGTYSIFGTVTDANGKPLAGVKIQSGPTHWTYTDANGNYQLAGLIDSSRTLTASLNNSTQSVPVAIAGSDVQGENFTL
ncbi:MAG: choice-of-anchor D domain-containing protein, partial [Thermoguttaceae bacterium]